MITLFPSFLLKTRRLPVWILWLIPFLTSGADTVPDKYRKVEYRIPMRDGVLLYTAVYIPRDASPDKRYPILMQRTCFGAAPYGPDQYKKSIGPSPRMQAEGYLFVYQDVRGRWASEGNWTNMTPVLSEQERQKNPKAIDESTDTYDTIEWLLRHVGHHNGRVGLWGISYAGFYAMAGSINAHPALKAISPQAPIADFFREDIHHNGAFTQLTLLAYPVFDDRRSGPTTKPWFLPHIIDTGNSTEFDWHKRLGALSNAGKYLAGNTFWQQTIAHPDYDSFWQRRSVLSQLHAVQPAVLIVGGWFDAEDLYGPLSMYKTLATHRQRFRPMLWMGPFGHRGWAEETGHTLHNDLYFGDSLATAFQEKIEAPFFYHYLKGAGDGKTGLPAVTLFDTGTKTWRTLTDWPAPAAKKRLFLDHSGALNPAQNGSQYREFTSDPADPVPYAAASLTSEPDFSALFGYMSADQRFVSSRKDVLTYQTDVLPESMTVGGEITVRLNVSTTGTDADWVLKVIDVYPDDEPNHPYMPDKSVNLAGYRQLVRGEVIRGRYRNSFEKPEPFTPGEETVVTLQLPDVLHTFRKGHRLMIQVQSSWFPLIDRNPQTFVPNMYKAVDSDFRAARHRVYSNSYIDFPLLP